MSERVHTVVVPPKFVVNVMGPDSTVLKFKVTTRTSLDKLMARYCERKCIARDTVAFWYNGAFLPSGKTAGDIGLKKNYFIDVVPRATRT